MANTPFIPSGCDIIQWPCGTNANRSDLDRGDYAFMSDDYEVIEWANEPTPCFSIEPEIAYEVEQDALYHASREEELDAYLHASKRLGNEPNEAVIRAIIAGEEILF